MLWHSTAGTPDQASGGGGSLHLRWPSHIFHAQRQLQHEAGASSQAVKLQDWTGANNSIASNCRTGHLTCIWYSLRLPPCSISGWLLMSAGSVDARLSQDDSTALLLPLLLPLPPAAAAPPHQPARSATSTFYMCCFQIQTRTMCVFLLADTSTRRDAHTTSNMHCNHTN